MQNFSVCHTHYGNEQLPYTFWRSNKSFLSPKKANDCRLRLMKDSFSLSKMQGTYNLSLQFYETFNNHHPVKNDILSR